MKHDGKRLEALVAFVEEKLLPKGFVVTTNDRVYSEEGVQIAEFDIQATGRVGSTDFVWLIECRDRPSSGPAPGSWIEQLVGRRLRFRFDKVTAVSTTGFAAGVAEFAKSQGIELREVTALTPDAFAELLPLLFMECHVRHSMLEQVGLVVAPTTPKELCDALAELLAQVNAGQAFLLSSTTGEKSAPADVFARAAESPQNLYEGLIPNGDAKKVRIHANYTPEDHFIVETSAGPVPVATIEFQGELRVELHEVPIAHLDEYRSTTTSEAISQHVSFEPFGGLATEVHHLAATGETHFAIRRVRGT